MKRFFLQRTRGHRDLADDLASQTWLEVLLALRERRYNPNRALFRSYLYGVACKVLFGHLRRAQREPASASREQIDRWKRIDEPPSLRLDLDETVEAMRSFVGGEESPLREIERQIVIRVARGDSERTIARDLALAPSTVNRRKKIAFRKIRSCLRKRGFA